MKVGNVKKEKVCYTKTFVYLDFMLNVSCISMITSNNSHLNNSFYCNIVHANSWHITGTAQ